MMQELIKEYYSKLEEMKEAITPLFMKELNSVFEKDENLESFSFSQYTPYFNDGDYCTFSFMGLHEFKLLNEEEPADEWKYSTRGDKEKELVESLDSLMNTIPSDILLGLFGDHVEVTINRDGTIEKDQMDHD
jgi:hypothetical protein